LIILVPEGGNPQLSVISYQCSVIRSPNFSLAGFEFGRSSNFSLAVPEKVWQCP